MRQLGRFTPVIEKERENMKAKPKITLTPGQKAAMTRKRRAAGRKAATTRKRREAARKAAVTRAKNKRSSFDQSLPRSPLSPLRSLLGA
jgi:hypothetical protein